MMTMFSLLMMLKSIIIFFNASLAKIHKMDLNLMEFNPAFLTRQRQEELKLQFEIEQLEREIENAQDEMDLIDEEFEHFQYHFKFNFQKFRK